jgi:hypothetical protein
MQLGIGEVLKKDFTSFGATDVAVAVVMGVIARAYMLVMSPLANVYLRGLGPIGDTINSASGYALLFALVALAAAIRSNGLTGLVSASVMAIVRVVTGDPFGVFSLPAFAFGAILGWLGMAALQYKKSYRNWLIWSFLWATGIQIIFMLLWGVYPILGSLEFGWIKLLTLDDILTAIVMGTIVYGLDKQLSGVQGLKTVYRTVQK